MYSAVTYRSILFSLVTILVHTPDVDNPIISPAFTSCHTHTNKPGINAYGTVGPGSPNMEYPPDGHSSQLRPSTTQLAPAQGEWKTIVTIIIALVAWPLLHYLGHIMKNGAQNHSTHPGGRSEAVSGPTQREILPRKSEDSLVQYDTKQHSFHMRPATVVSADDAPQFCDPTNPSLLLDGEPEKLNGRTGTCPQTVPTASCGCSLQLPTAGEHYILRIWNWIRVGRSEQTLAHDTIPPHNRPPLRRSLYQGSRDLGEGFPGPQQCILLFVGVDTPGQKDAENDINYLRQMIESSPHRASIRYERIYGSDATFANVRDKVLAVLNEAQKLPKPSKTFLLFSGTGDENNAMCLADGSALSESDLSQWLSASAIDLTKEPVSLLFDICRTNRSRPAIALQPAELAWSCSVGEFAYAIRPPQGKLAPRSIFLLAIFMAAHDTVVHGLDGCYFEAAFALHIKQLSDLILHMYHRAHRSRCSYCPPDKQCDPPSAQNPDLEQARGAVVNLGMLVAEYFSQQACEVFYAVDNKMLDVEFPGGLCPLSALRAKQSNKPTVQDES
ncbi:hypothetical protein RSOLAG22IIIB_03557 [Rhizoctonia solani]|uniref:Uncharacterized protein n=1 Tax=Rhizoctonia solani TaxID=456999 RepID=A0A0K6FRB3_9AGAM|nr:hypothetical protein RSOLAG22IIIB_03557 [Rhizoctonia solani]